MTRSKVLFCYNNNDKDELDQLVAAITPMIGEENVLTWDDSRVLYNEEWEDEMADSFDEAEVLVLLLGLEFFDEDTQARELFMEYVREAKDDGVYVLPWRTHVQTDGRVLPFVMNNPFDQASVSLDTPESPEAATGRFKAFARLIHGLREARKSQQQPDDTESSDPESLKQLADHLKKQGYAKEAEALYLLVLAVRRSQFGPDHLDTASSIHDLAVLFRGARVVRQSRPSPGEPPCDL